LNLQKVKETKTMRKLFSALVVFSLFPLVTACGDDDGPSLDGITEDITDDLPNPLDQCELECSAFAETGGSVSGIVEVDAFFRSVVNFNAQAGILKADIRAILGEMAAGMGLKAEAGASIDELSAMIEGHVKGGFGGNIEGGIKLEYQPPKCAVSAQATIQASAQCDASVKPGEASVKCEGSCEVEASAMASCEGEVKCTGTAPSFKCEGTCTGSCELEAGAKCEGTCSGSCEVASEAECDGEFQAGTGSGASGGGTCKLNAGAKCEGECKGSCELTAGAECKGECKGECTYDPGGAECSGKASCEASGSASVECKGECKGNVEPPEVKAECKASAKAEASFSAECTPPKVGLSYKLAASGDASGDADVKAAMEAQVTAFANAYGKLVAKLEKVQLVVDAGANLAADGAAAVEGAADVIVGGEGDFLAIFGAGCAIDSLPMAVDMVGAGGDSLKETLTATGKISAALGG
jgi:hypothetical protein